MINNFHKKYNGLSIEFKTPNANGKISDVQKEILAHMKSKIIIVLCSMTMIKL